MSSETPPPNIRVTNSAYRDSVVAALRDTQATVVIADPAVAQQVQEQTALPPLPPGPFGSALVAEAGAAGVLVRAVVWAALVMADPEIGPLVIVGTEKQCAAVLAAAERALAAKAGSPSPA